MPCSAGWLETRKGAERESRYLSSCRSESWHRPSNFPPHTFPLYPLLSLMLQYYRFANQLFSSALNAQAPCLCSLPVGTSDMHIPRSRCELASRENMSSHLFEKGHEISLPASTLSVRPHVAAGEVKRSIFPRPPLILRLGAKSRPRIGG